MQLLQLTQIVLNTTYSSNEIPEFEKDGSVKIFRNPLGIFSTFAKCEEMILKWIEKTKDYDYTLGYEVVEKTLDGSLCGPHDSLCTFWSKRTYFPDGKLCCECKLDDACIKKFNGHDGVIPLKVKDLAWVLNEHEVEPAIVIDLPPKHLNANGDYSDDSYTVITANGHQHPLCTDVFPYNCKLPRRVEKKLFRELKWYEDGNL